MRRYFFIGILFFTLVFNLASGSMAQSPSGPRMVLQEYSFNFMEVKEGNTLEHSFKVTNQGDQPLEIKKVNPS